MSDPGLMRQRYGATRRRSPAVVAAVGGGVATVFLGWLAWAAWAAATPDVSSELVGYDVVDQRSALGIVDVAVRDGVDPADVSCLIRATAYDHTTVGEESFTPEVGRQRYEVRTEREATTVELVGCTTPEQSRPR